MTTVELKSTLIERIAQINDKSILEAIKNLLESNSEVDLIQLSTYQKKRVEESRQQIRDGEFVANDDLQQKVEEWLSTK